MKINVKLFLLTFTIITFVSGSSAFIYNLLTHQLLKTQQSKSLVNSANDFIFEFQKIIQKLDEEFQHITSSQLDFGSSNLDILFQVDSDSIIDNSTLLIKDNLSIYADVNNLSEFLKYNSNLIVRTSTKDQKKYFYGTVINATLINKLSEKIRAEIAFVENDVVTKFSNNQEYQYYLPYLSRVTRELKFKHNFEIISETINEADFSATHYSPKFTEISNPGIDFIIYNISKEAAEFNYTMKLVTVVIVVSGILLTAIFLLLFTTKFRKQLEYINAGVIDIAKGENPKKVKVISKDEIGNLGNAFNNMLEEIAKRDLVEKEYSEFISLINKKTSLEEIGDATLSKIINYTKVDAGALYLHEKGKFKPFSVFGISKDKNDLIQDSSFYKKAIEKRELVEIKFADNNPIIQTGIAELKISILYILPIFYNHEIIAILELALVNQPEIDIKNYLNKIKDQLAIGLANSKALSELKLTVDELKVLNSAYQQQNEEILEKNQELIYLHDKLKKGSEELEYQTAKAVESERVKSQFLANMSHELRTPQNSILGLTELILKDNSIDSKTKERLNVVLRNGKKLLNLIENILEYSKLESGNSELKISNIKLTDLTEEIISFITPLFLEREIQFIVNIDNDKDYELNIDQKKIEQIIYNLIGNAAKFTKKGYVKLEIKIVDNNLEIVVEDTGPGISDEDKKIIFEEFRQADGNLNRRFDGTGLGLAICKRYCEILNGKIELTSTLDMGSKFKVTFPNVANPVNMNDIGVKKQNENKLDVVIISDGADSAKMIADYLSSYKINVKTVTSKQIQSSISLGNPEIIIIDILLKNGSGWEFLSDLKSDLKYKDIPMVVINMDEEANCGLGLNIYKYHFENLQKQNVHKAIELIEAKQSIKFRRILFLMNDEGYNLLEDELIADDLKFYNSSDYETVIEDVKRYEPDLLIIDLFDEKMNSIKILTQLNSDIFTNTVPILAFVNSLSENRIKKINNDIIETTLLYQYHPLDVLKIIKDRIDLLDNSIIPSEQYHYSSPNLIDRKSKSLLSENNLLKVLIVDDDSDARFTINELVKGIGYKTILASDGYECLEKLKIENPDIVLLDIMMPKMDGFQTIKKIREDKDYQHTKVYALTAYAMLSDKEIIEKNGFDGLFTKPLNTKQIERKLTQILEKIN